MKKLKSGRSFKGQQDKDQAKTVRIGDADVVVATPAGKPKNRSAAEIRAAVRAHIQSAK
jgi:hypothetical protein